MEKVDIAIAVLGVVALVSTGLGIGLYEDGNVSYTVTTSNDQAISIPAENVPTGGLTWEEDVPMNGYDATGTITIDWSGTTAPDQSFAAGSTVDVVVTVTAPDGSVQELPPQSFAYTDKSGTIDFNVDSWLEVPSNFDGDAQDLAEREVTWNSPLFIDIVIQGPQGPIPGQPQDDPVYTAAFDGNWQTYSISQDTPDLETV